LSEHLADAALGDVEEPAQVDRGDEFEVLGGVFGERFEDEDAGVVIRESTRANRSTAVVTTCSAVAGLAISPGTPTTPGSPDCLIDRELATTAYPCSR
jgi:hypothetical protein